MQFSSFADFIAMGGYGFYVWLSFGTGFLLLAILGLQSKQYGNKVKTDIAKKLARKIKLQESLKH
jgi:heme exporter protein D